MSTMKQILVMMTVPAILFGCTTTNENQAKYLPDELDVKERGAHKNVGVTGDDEIVIESNRSPMTELKMQQKVNEMLETELHSEHADLQNCRVDLADPRLGGTGRMPDTTDIDDLKTEAEIRTQVGLNEQGDLRVVNRQYYVEELKTERKYERSMRQMISLVRKHRQKCEREMRFARVKNGLPAERIKAEGYFLEDGTWVETRRGEQTLDDAFEIISRGRDKNSNRGKH